MGAHHAPDEPEPDRGPVPAVVLTSFWLWLVVAGLVGVTAVDAARRDYWDLVAFFVGILVVQLVAALRMVVGRSWARTILMMVGAQQIIAGLRTIGQDSGHPMLTGPVPLSLVLAAGVLMFLPTARRYFADLPPALPAAAGPTGDDRDATPEGREAA